MIILFLGAHSTSNARQLGQKLDSFQKINQELTKRIAQDVMTQLNRQKSNSGMGFETRELTRDNNKGLNKIKRQVKKHAKDVLAVAKENGVYLSKNQIFAINKLADSMFKAIQDAATISNESYNKISSFSTPQFKVS